MVEALVDGKDGVTTVPGPSEFVDESLPSGQVESNETPHGFMLCLAVARGLGVSGGDRSES
jgi:hypothetical protein